MQYCVNLGHASLVCLLVLISGCVEQTASRDAAWRGDAEATGVRVDADCLNACLDKGASPRDCELACQRPEDKPNSADKDEFTQDKPSEDQDASSTTQPETSEGAGPQGPDDVDQDENGELDAEKEAFEEARREKNCIECFYGPDQANGECADEIRRCENSLACTQLQWCPSLCEADDCIESCREIIPQGVEPLQALVRCLACNGGPCADACEGRDILAYCQSP